ncbi:MAG: hypothetical protein IKD31_04025 [Clostridia bacterium]|nr:hypothetical protein [Clostridia bacterium]
MYSEQTYSFPTPEAASRAISRLEGRALSFCWHGDQSLTVRVPEKEALWAEKILLAEGILQKSET